MTDVCPLACLPQVPPPRPAPTRSPLPLPTSFPAALSVARLDPGPGLAAATPAAPATPQAKVQGQVHPGATGAAAASTPPSSYLDLDLGSSLPVQVEPPPSIKSLDSDPNPVSDPARPAVTASDVDSDFVDMVLDLDLHGPDCCGQAATARLLPAAMRPSSLELCAAGRSRARSTTGGGGGHDGVSEKVELCDSLGHLSLVFIGVS